MKRALISGITGQDGSYLAELLLDEGYEVHGLVRRVALEDPTHRLSRLAPVLDRIQLHSASLESFPSLYTAILQIQPDEIYHLAAQSFVSYSFEDAFSTFRTNIDGTHFILESVRQCAPRCRVYFAGSSEMFGNAPESPQSERTPFCPRSPYGVSKLTGFHLARNYREAYGLFVCSGIMFNHESPRRGFEFVTRKVTSHAVRIKLGQAKQLPLGQSRRPPRLGLREGFRAGDAPHASGRETGRLRRGDRRNAFGPRLVPACVRLRGTGLSRTRRLTARIPSPRRGSHACKAMRARREPNWAGSRPAISGSLSR